MKQDLYGEVFYYRSRANYKWEAFECLSSSSDLLWLMIHVEWCRLWAEDKDLLEELFWVYQSGIRHVSKRLLSFFSPFPSKNFDAIIFLIPSGCISFYGSVSMRWTFHKSRVTIKSYEKLLQIYISELLNLTGSLGQLSELRLLCCSGLVMCLERLTSTFFMILP